MVATLLQKKNASEHRYLEMTVGNDYIHAEIKSKSISGNVCYHSFQNPPSSRPSRNL